MLCLVGVARAAPVLPGAISPAAAELPGEETHASLLKSEMKMKSAKPYLDTVKQLRQLSSAEAEQLIPVKLTGVVTDLSGYKNSFFFQDETGGISVDRTDSADVHAGDRVEIVGTSGPGLFAPVVLASRVTVMGQSSPPPTHRFMYGDLFGGVQDSQWVEIEGIVHTARMEEVDENTLLHLRLEIGGGSVNVLLQDFAGVDIAHLVDARVSFQGVCATDFNQKKQFVGLDLYVPSTKFMKVLEPARTDPFGVPTMPIGNALQFGQAQHRVKVSGVSTYQNSGRGIYLQNGSDGIGIQASGTRFIGTGRQVEAVGFPVLGDYGPILEDALLRELGPATPIVPIRIMAKNVITQDGDFYQVPYDQQLVQIQGRVEESHVAGERRVLLLRDGNEVFEASFPLSGKGSAPGTDNGTLLLLTGICVVHADLYHNPVSFSILLNTPQDIVILNRASWWTAQHTLAILAAFMGVMSVVVLWVVILKTQVKHQTNIIRQSEERFRHLAEHDYLTGLPNRLMLEEHMRRCLEVCAAKHTLAAVFTIDIDYFKKINDTHGHLVGDECLKIVASRLRGTVRKMDVIARIGGEEFMLIVGSLRDSETAFGISSAILDLFQGRVVVQGVEIPLTVSIGGALYPTDGTDSGSLRKMSDQALYQAKQSGRNRAVFTSPESRTFIPIDSAGRDPADRLGANVT
ncbi:diguanylate cyclase [Granulicella aggregans]|uniref:diguanylate cyclase n=1 Tax=Granulicella aggregans TaxID=474949 RepID=UPI0021DF76D2|nr:diguanylate cyclase [Granulicella aggregans]